MSSVGFDRSTFSALTGWDHIRQSIAMILTTELGERIQRRPFGSKIADLIDKPQTVEIFVDVYMAVAEALEPRVVDGAQLGEPRFLLSSIAITPSADGSVIFRLRGTEFPRGHLGDFSPARERSISIPMGAMF